MEYAKEGSESVDNIKAKLASNLVTNNVAKLEQGNTEVHTAVIDPE